MIITNLLQGLIGVSVFDYKILFMLPSFWHVFLLRIYSIYYSDKEKEKPTNHLLSKVMDKNYYLLFAIFSSVPIPPIPI